MRKEDRFSFGPKAKYLVFVSLEKMLMEEHIRKYLGVGTLQQTDVTICRDFDEVYEHKRFLEFNVARTGTKIAKRHNGLCSNLKYGS